jgi:hypothetical protein
MSRWFELSERVEALAEQIAAFEEQEIVDGGLSIEKVGAIIVFDEALKEERLVLQLEELVDEMLEDARERFDLDIDDEHRGAYEAALGSWAELFRRLADRIEAAMTAST